MIHFFWQRSPCECCCDTIEYFQNFFSMIKAIFAPLTINYKWEKLKCSNTLRKKPEPSIARNSKGEKEPLKSCVVPVRAQYSSLFFPRVANCDQAKAPWNPKLRGWFSGTKWPSSWRLQLCVFCFTYPIFVKPSWSVGWTCGPQYKLHCNSCTKKIRFQKAKWRERLRQMSDFKVGSWWGMCKGKNKG